MDDMYLFKSQDEGNRLLYAYYKGEFWVYDPNVQQWYISGHVREQYELAAQKEGGLTPDDFTCTGYGYEFVAEYEVPVAVLDALRAAKKVLPPEPASAEPPEIVDEGSWPEDGANPTPAAPASRADAGAAAQSLSAAGPASLAAEGTTSQAFDYTGLDDPTRDTLRWAEREIGEARRDYIARLAQAVSIAHDALCSGVVQNLDNSKHGNRGENAFANWCESVGIKRSTAYNLLQVQALLSGSTPEEQATLEAASPSLLYAAAKPSAPAELVQAVKDGDITTNKQYQEALAEIRARDEKITELLEMSEAADRRADKAEQAVKDTARERDAALRHATEAEKQRDGARDALQAAKLRGDKLKAENDALKAHPIEAQVVDEEEINRRAQARADELTAPLREELETLRNRHPADLEEAEQAIRDAYDSAIYTSRTIENAWHSLRPLLSCMDSERRVMAVRQLEKILTKTQEELRKCL